MKALAFVFALILVGFWAGCSRAQDDHAQGHDWYQHLKQPGTGYGCCDNRDCRPTRAYREDDGTWRAVVDGRWVDVPAGLVLTEKAPDGRSHICANLTTGRIYCFVPGEPRS